MPSIASPATEGHLSGSELRMAGHFLALWCNSSMTGFDPDGLGANPSEAANFRLVVK